MNYESLIFDIDGTLWDSRALIAEGYNIQLRKEGLHHLQTNADVLLKLEKALDLPKEFWTNLEEVYRAKLEEE